MKLRADRREERRREAEERNAAWAKLTTAEKVSSLNRRGARALRQRKKLGVL